MTGENLAHHLNEIGFETSYGTPYEGGRGTYKLISDTYDWFVDNGKQADADNIAMPLPNQTVPMRTISNYF